MLAQGSTTVRNIVLGLSEVPDIEALLKAIHRGYWPRLSCLRVICTRTSAQSIGLPSTTRVDLKMWAQALFSQGEHRNSLDPMQISMEEPDTRCPNTLCCLRSVTYQ